MTEPVQHLCDAFNFFPRRNKGTTHHHDRQSEIARSLDLGISGVAAGVPGNDDVDAMLHQHRAVAGEIERPARHDHLRILHRQRRARRIDQPDQIEMLRMRGEKLEMLPPDAEKYPTRCRTQGVSRRGDVVNFDPAIGRRALPGCTLKRQQRHSGQSTGRNRVRAHLRCEWMGGIDHARDFLCADIIDQTIDAAKTADAPANRRRRRIFGTAGIGQDRIDTWILGDRRHQPVGVGGAAEDQDPQWFDRGGCHGRQR